MIGVEYLFQPLTCSFADSDILKRNTMKNISRRHIGAIALAVVGGLILGFIQDPITTSLASLSFLSTLLVVAMIGWFVCMVWYGMAFRISGLRRLGVNPTPLGLIFLLLAWVFTVIGGTLYLSLNGALSMPLFGLIILSMGMAMAYNFFLVVLPLFIFWGLQSAPRKHRRARPGR
jgi:hypothetical protein